MPIDYEFKIADKSYTVSRDEIEENGGMSKFAEFYPDATIRMKRDEDGKEFDIPVSEYEWATGRGMRPWKIERKTVVKAPESDNRTSNQSASVNNDNLSTPTPASLDESTSSVMIESDSVATPQPIDDEGYVFSAEDIDKVADVGEQSATASQENDAMLSDERQETTTRVGNAQEQQKQSIPTSPLVQMAEERKKQLSGYLSDYFNNVSQKVNTAINKPEQIEVPKDENGNDIYPGAVDLLELSLKETEPALKELAKNTREEVIKSVRQKYGDLMMKANGPADFSREMQEEEAPSKVLEAALAKVRNDENYKKLIAAEANRLEIDVEDYIEDIVKPILQNEIYGIEIESRRPKTAGEYWLGRAVGGSMLGMMNSIANDPLEVRQLNEAAMQAYNPNQVEEIAGTFGSIVMDLPFMAITGGIGSQAGKAVLYPTVQRLVAQGVSKPIAWGIATRAAQRNALGYGVRVASEAVNFATLEGLGSTIGQAYMTGDVDAGQVGAAFAKGAVTGATMGIFGISNEALGRTFTKQLGEGVGRVGTYTTSLGGRTAILTGSSVVGQWMEDPNFDINNVDWTNEFVHAGLINIGFDVIGVIKRAGKEKMNVRPEDLFLSKENIRQLNDAGFKGKNAAEIAENLLKGRTKIKESADAGLVGREQQGVRQESDPIYSELSRLLQDSSIDLSTKSKVAYLMTGMVHQLSPNTSISDVIDANGEYVVEKYNTSGQTNEQRRFSTKEEAQQYIKESRSEIKGNQVRALEEMMNTAGRIASATSLFDMIAKDSGISREQLMDIYVRGRKGEPLNQQEKGIYKTTEQILQSTKEVKTYHYDIAEIKTMLDEGYGQKKGWMDKVLKKKYNDLNETERRAYDEYILNMQLRLQGNKSQSTGEYSRLGSGTKLLGNSGQVGPTSGEETPVGPLGTGTEEVPVVSNLETAKINGRSLYEEHDPAKIRQQYLRTIYSLRRLSQVNEDAVSQINDARTEEEVERVIASLPEEQRRYAADYAVQSWTMDAIDEALSTHYADDEVLTDRVMGEVFGGGKESVPVVRLDDKTGIVVLNGMTPEGGVEDASGRVMGVSVPLINGVPDWKSFDGGAVRSYQVKSEDIISMPTQRDVVEFMLADKFAEEGTIFKSSPISVGATFPVLLDGEIRDVSVVGIEIGNWLVEVIGEKGIEPVTNEELEQWKHDAELFPIVQEYAEIDNSINYGERIGEEVRPERNEAHDTVGISAGSQTAHEVGVHQGPTAGVDETAGGRRTGPEDSGRESSVQGAVAEVPGDGLKESALTRLAVYPEGHAKAGRPDYESSRVEDVRDYLLESLGEEKALKTVDNTISANESRLKEKQDYADRFVVEMENSALEVDDMLRAQEQLKAVESEVAALQKSVDYWKGVRTALGGEEVLMDKQGNPIAADGKLIVEEINSIDDISDDDFNAPTRNIQLPILPLHIDKAIGANGKPVVIKKNIFNKNRKNHKDLGASDSRYILNNVFYNTNMYGQNQKVSRPYNWILIHTADKNSAVIVEVNEGKDNVEVVGWQYLRGNSLEQKKRQAIKEGGLILTLENAAGDTLNGSSSASKDNAGLSDVQEKGEESLPPLDKKVQRRINAAQTREKNRLSAPKEWSEMTKAKTKYNSYPAIMDVLNSTEPSNGNEYAAMWLASNKITPESFRAETGYGLNEQKSFVGMIASAENGGVSIEHAAELLAQDDEYNYFGGDDYNARNALIHVLGEVSNRGDLLHYIDNRRIAEADRMYEKELEDEREYLNEITMRDYDMSVDDYEADRVLWNDYMDEVIEERLSGWENFRDSKAYFDLFDIFALESKTEENGREDTRNVLDGREKGIRDDIGNESAGVRESGSSLQGRGIGSRTAIAEGNGLRDSGGGPERGGTFEPSNPVEPSVSSGNVAFESGGEESRLSDKIASAESDVDTSPTEAQKKAGNYKKGHVQIGSFNVTIEQPKGSVRSGVDKDVKKWSTTMQNTYGYIRGTEGVDGDHIDVFLSNDIDGWDGRKVFVVDQYNPDGSFDEHKVMLGFNDIDDADAAYLSNYGEGWSDNRKIVIRPSTLEDFEKWINSSHRKTKPFAEYKSVQIAEQRIAEKEKSDVLYTVTPTQYTTKKGKELSMHLVTFAKDLSKEQYKAAKEIAKSDKGWYDAKKGGFMMRSEESAKDLAERVVSEGAAPIAEAQPSDASKARVVKEQQPSKVEDDKYKPIWEYHVSVDKETGRTTLSRDDVSGIIPIGDGRFKVYADSPEEMLDILRNPLNRMDEVLKEVEVTLENKITTRDLDRKIREEREQKRADLRKNGVNGYKIGEKVVYTPISSSRKAIEATIHDFEEYGTNKPVLDTGLGPVMYEVADWDRIKKSETVKENAAGLQESDKNISFEESQSKEIDNGRRIEKENSGLRKESGQEVERAERRRDVGGLHGNNVSDTSGGGRVSVGDGEQLTSVARVNNSRNYSFGENHLDLPTGEIGKLKGNIEAIRLLKELEESGRVATDAEKEVLRQFVGWGGLSESLNEDEYSRWQRYQKITTWDGIPGSTPWGKKYGSHYEALRPLLSDEEFKQAQASTLNSHYTPEVVIRGMWSALEQLGFKGGDILEPAMGIGHMIGFMPKEISGRSTIFGYELDSIPGRIARQLYPDAFIEVAGYETSFRPNSKDAVVTNVPFGQTAPIDPSLDKTLRKKLGSSYNLHNYFIVKGLLELRPGGVGAFVTSSSTMDGRNSKAREYISSLGVDLVGAIRLPNTAFKSNAGTEVTADLLFFRKRYPGEAGNGISFVSLSEIGKGHYIGKDKHGNDMLMEVPLLVNEYFATHPEMMLGEMMTAHDAGSGGLYGGDSQTLVGKKGADLGVELMTAISNLPENILTSRPTSTTAAPKERTSVKDGVLSVKDGKVYVSDSGVQSEVTSGTFKHDGKVRSYADAAKDYLTLKESLKDLIRAEQTETADPVALRSRVNSLYDDFVSKYGRLNENRALNVILEEDVERFLPQSLEKVETVYDASGRRRKVVSKADGILLRRVSQPMKAPEKADNLQDAIDVSQSYYGRMDINYISKLLSISPAEARERILSERQGYEDPLTGDLIDRDAYLSGNVREKLNVAREAAERDERFSINVSDLEQSLPETIPFVDISYKLGTPWIPEGVYQEFAQEVLGLNGMSIRYVPVADEFMITGGHTSDYTKANEYNTPHRDAIDIFTDAINMRKPTIYRQVDRNTRVKDEAATQEVVAKIVDMNDAFVRYIQEKSDVHSELQRIYNERYNNYRLREYRFPQFTGADGKIHYPGSNELIALRDHQTKAVQRSLQGSTLLAHQVGTGKTFTMITTAMEMRRLGLAKKPMIVVQNATLQDFASDFMKLYPGANILVPDENERSAKHRKRLFNLIATGDFDAIIVPQSFLAFIPDDPGRKKALIEQRVEEIMQAAEQLDDRRMADRLRREAKALSESISVDESTAPTRKTNVKKQAKKEESALARETRKLDRRTDDVLTFEQMGVDALFIDEAHNFKKIGFTTKMQNVKGIDTGYSERANSLLLKASYVQERNGGRNVILATGTPITNTMAEVWTMMRFVAPEILEDYGIKTFDEFAATFGQVEPSLEQNSTGGFKISDRFKSYVNVPELVKAFRSHADVVLTSDVPEFKEKNSLPRLKDDKMTNHVIHKSDALEDVMNVLVEALKADEQKTGKEKTPGLPLVVFSKAKQAAIDLRLINPSYPDDPNSKTNKVVSEVLRVYKESAEQKGIQMVFCDSYQSPEKEPAIDLFDFDPSVPRFNLYRDIKEKLIAGGIPKDEIVIVNEITSAERKKAVFEKARQGEVRVLIGGTEKMGVGVNVQDRMVALHHMDAPIRPMDFEQRNGRILRQGNMYATLDKPVEILTYGVEGTLDATAYDRLRIKQNFINQMMKGDVSGRVMEDNADDDPSGKTFSQMAAELSGDKTLQLLFVAENKLKKLAGLKRSHEIKKQYAREEIPLAEKTISIRESYLEKLERLSERAAKQFPNGIERITLNGHTFTDKLSKVLSEGVGMYEEQYKENRGIAPLSVKLNNDNGELLFYHNNGMLMYKLSLGKEDVVTDKEINTFAGIWPSVTSALSGLSRRVDDARKDVSERKSRLTGLRSVVQKSFDKEAELDAARAEVSALRSELEKKAQESASVAVDDSVVKEKLKGGRETEVSEPLADYDDVSLYRMENMINDSRSVAVNAPDALVVKSGRDIVNGMPGLSTVEMAFVMQECQRRDVCAMYVPKTRQILILPGHGTAREMRNAYWHESLHYGVDMALPKGDYGRLLLEHAAKDVDELDPELSRWVEEHYGKDIQEEKLIHLLDEVISYISDHGKLESLRKGLNFGPEHPVLNDVCNRLLKYLTDGKEIRGNSGNDVRDTEENYGENQEWKDESQSADVFRGTYEGVGIKHSVLGGDLERTHLRRLKEGETSHVERLFKENKNFDFTSGERINSIEDVAYIFKNLEDESVENSFAVLVDKDGRPTVVHLGMGSYAYSLVNGSALQVAVSRIKPKKITFVHNHPSGTLKASAQDREVLKKLKSAYGANVVTDGIIINLRSGKFGVYGEFPYDSEYKDELGKVLNESSIKVYSFNKLAFSKNYDPSTLPLANSQEAVAEFISSQRLGERDKLGLLVCDQQLRVVGNVFLRESSLTEKNLNQVAQDVVYYTTAMGGTRPILFGNGIKGLSAKLYPLIDDISLSTIKLTDVVELETVKEDEASYNGLKLENVNERFNNELDNFKAMRHNGLLHLGTPLMILSAAGVHAKELTISPKILNRKMKQHGLTTDDLKGLAEAIQFPILVYKHGKNTPNLVIITELNIKGGKLSVSLELDESGNVVEINNVSSVHSKDAKTELIRLSKMGEEELQKGLRWVEKEKVQDWLGIADLNRPIHTNNPELISIANVIESFENPSVEDENLSLVDKDELEVRYSLRDKPRRRPGESLISYNRRLELWKNELDEAKRRREVENEVRNELDDFPQLQPGEDYSSQSFLDRLEEYRQRIAELRATERRDEIEIVDEALYDPSTLQTETYDSDTSDRMSEEELREVRNAFTQKMKEVKIPVSKEQLKRDIKQEIIERRRYIETSNLEDAIFVDELKKMAGKGKKGAEVLRDIPSYIEGTYTGTPSEELKTCAKKVQDWFEEVYNILAMEGVLYDAPRIQNYVTHIWDWERTPKQVQEAYANWMSTMRLRSPYTRHRIIPSYAEGIAMGMVPKYDDITGIIMEYGHYANEVIANHRILKFLMNFSVKMPGTKNDLPSDMPVITNDKVKSPSYSRMNHTALDGYKVLNVVKPFITPIFGDQKIVDPSHMNPIANKLVDAFWLASGSMKKMVLSFSFFHHGALTETAIAMDRPWGAMKTIAKDLMWDVLVNGNIPAMNDKQAARDAVEHLVSLGATQDYAAADVRNFTTKLAKWAKRQNLAVAKEATQLLDFLNSGSDKLLWDVIHDGFKIASFRKMATEVRAQAEREGWSKEQLENTLDECGQLVNDTYGGLHWDILGFSPKTVRILRALLLSPDWTFATIRQALSPFGVGQLYQQDSFWRRVKDNGLGTTLKETTPGGIRKKYGRQFWLTAMIFFYGVMNALNAYFRVKDEDDEEKKAEEMRQLNPDYRSPYELAYPNGMKWYDYTMAGNALGHQTHLFAGHYSDGTESYVRWGKQFRELPELFFGRDGFSIPGPMIDKISGKVNPLMSTIFTLISGHSLNGFENKDMKNKKGWERDVARLYVLAKAWLPYSVPTQEDKDFMWIDLMMPSSKGMTPYKAIDYFKKAIMSGDSTYVSNVYSSVVLNGLDAAKYLELASRSIEAEAKKNMIEGIETVDDAVNAFDNSEHIKDRKRLVRYIEQQVGAQDFEQVEREEVLNRALDILAGDGVDNKSNDIYVGLMSGEDVLEDYRMKKTIAGLKPYYDDYKSLVTEDADAARRMYNEKKRYIEGYQKAIRYRNAISKLKKTLGKGKDDGVMDKIRDLRKKMFQSLDE